MFSSGPSGFTYTQDLSPKRAFECLQQAVQRLYELDRGSSPIDATLLKDLQRPATTGLQVITSKLYTLFRTDPIMVMNLPPRWTRFEDYLAEMKSNYRRHAKKVVRAGSKLKHQDLSVEQIEAEKAAIFGLFYAVFKRAHYRFGCLTDDYFVCNPSAGFGLESHHVASLDKLLPIGLEVALLSRYACSYGAR